jgi:hypothetical protein
VKGSMNLALLSLYGERRHLIGTPETQNSIGAQPASQHDIIVNGRWSTTCCVDRFALWILQTKRSRNMP